MTAKKLIWVLVSSLIGLLTLVVSCSSGTTTAPATTPAQTTNTVAPSTSVAPTTVAAATPQYGGTLTELAIDPLGFDQAYTSYIFTAALGPVEENLIESDWTKGPLGSNQSTWAKGYLGRYELLTGGLAQSWELPDDSTIIFHIRQGVHWQNLPPANGREFTAQDAAFNQQRMWTATKSYQYTNYAAAERPTSFTALDKYTLQIMVQPKNQGIMLTECGYQLANVPPEIVPAGGVPVDWHHVVGTGPFILSDYVTGSSITYLRNPNYWQTDPIGSGKGKQLPYVDGMKQLIIPDTSTEIAALRTGKIDIDGTPGAAGSPGKTLTSS